MIFLIIDDDEFKIEMTKKHLTQHTVATTRSYNSGMRTIIAGGIDGIILDMGFPRWDDGMGFESDIGLEVLYEMRRRNINIPVIVHSGSSFNTEEFNNVIDYALTGPTLDLQRAIEKLIKECEK